MRTASWRNRRRTESAASAPSLSRKSEISTTSPRVRGAAKYRRSAPNRLVRPLRLDALQEAEYLRRLILAAPGRQHLTQPVGEGDQIHAIVVQQCHVGQGRGHALGVVELSRLAVIHRQARVEEDVHGQVGLFLEQPQDEPVHAQVDAPVDVANVVAFGVGAVVREHHAGTGAPRAVHALELPMRPVARDQGQCLELAQKRFGEKHVRLVREG